MTLRPAGARVLAACVVVACGVAEVALAAHADVALLLRASAPLGLLAVGALALFWAPSVRIDPAEVVLVNPMRTVRVRWPAITDVRTRWGLELDTVEGRFAAWAAPRPGSVSAARAARLRVRRTQTGALTPVDEPVLDPSAAAGEVVDRQWRSYRDAGLLGAVEGEGVVVERRLAVIAALVLLTAASLASAFLP